jgi:hypothetical protein
MSPGKMMRRKAIDAVLAEKGVAPLTDAEFLVLLPHEGWSPETCANMIVQLRRVSQHS